MFEVIKNQVIVFLMGTILTASFSYTSFKFKKISEENNAIKEGIKALLHDRVQQMCNYFLKEKCFPFDERKRLEKMYDQYKLLGGNGTVKALVERTYDLPYDLCDTDKGK